MSGLLLSSFVPPSAPRVDIRVAAAEWRTLRYPQADLLVAAVAGLIPARGHVVLDDVAFDGLPATERAASGLGTATCRLPDLPTLRVLDAVLLARGVGGPWRSWRAALGLGRAGADLADQEAAGRALTGRAGLARWADRSVVSLPAPIAALADIARATAAQPRALVWRVPQWLGPGDVRAATELVREEQHRCGFAVLEVRGTETP